MPRISSLIVLVAAVLVGGTVREASALPHVTTGQVSVLVQIDGSQPNSCLAGNAESQCVMNQDETKPDAVLLLQFPEGFLPTSNASADYSGAKATLTLFCSFARWTSEETRLQLLPLARPFDPAAVTWNSNAADSAWATAGGDILDGFALNSSAGDACEAIVGEDATNTTAYMAYTFDLVPALSNQAVLAALGANGAIVRIDPDAVPASGKSFIKMSFANPAVDAENLAPALFAAIPNTDWDTDTRLFAVAHIDNAPKKGSAETVLWEQGTSSVGKVVLNGSSDPLSECRAILSMPEDLVAANPARIQSVVAHFQTYGGETDGTESLILYPLLSGPALERRDWTGIGPGQEPSCPTHGPSWAYADGPVDPNDATYARSAWPIPQALNTNGVSQGPWAAEYAVRAELGATVAEFDLTDLWHDETARGLLVSNGAIVVMDPARWESAIAQKACPRINLYRPDPGTGSTYDTWMRFSEYEHVAVASTRIDSAKPDANYADDGTMKVVLSADGSEVRGLYKFSPDLFGDHFAGANLTLVYTTFRQAGLDGHEAVLHPLARPFRVDSATWNAADADTPWTTPGGDYLPAYAAGHLAKGCATFDLTTLLADPETAAALRDNGALMRLAGDFPESGNAMLNGSSSATTNAPEAPIVLAAPKALAIDAMAYDAATSSLTFTAEGLDPLKTYAIYATDDLSLPLSGWQHVRTLSLSGPTTLSIDPTASQRFYAIRTVE